jgi:hypothetical protein
MKHFPAIEAAFEHKDFQHAVATAIEWAPELKHESLVNTMLSCLLRKNDIASVREVKAAQTLNSRRYDLTIDGTPLETKYHLDFDVDSVLSSVQNPIGPYSASPSTWHAGDQFLNELHRANNSYFLWSVCDRGPNPPVTACMRTKTLKWLNKLQKNSNSSGYVLRAMQSICNIVSREFPDVSSEQLPSVLVQKSNIDISLHSILFFHGD